MSHAAAEPSTEPTPAALLAEKARKHYRLLKIGVLALLALACVFPFTLSLYLRHIALFAILRGFWLPMHWQSAILRMRPERGRLPVMLPGRWMTLALVAAILAGVVVQREGEAPAEPLTAVLASRLGRSLALPSPAIEQYLTP